MRYSQRSRVKTKLKQKHSPRHTIVIRRSNQHLYAVLLSIGGSRPLMSVGTPQLIKTGQIHYGGNIAASESLAVYMHEKLKSINITEVSFNRSGWPYHGRIKAFASKLRDLGITI